MSFRAQYGEVCTVPVLLTGLHMVQIAVPVLQAPLEFAVAFIGSSEPLIMLVRQ